MNTEALSEFFKSSEILLWSAGIFVFNVSITVIEAAYDRATGKSRRWRDSGANVIIFFMSQLLERLALGAIAFLGLLPFYFYLSPYEIPMTATSWIAALLAADLTYYWMHRTEHKTRILWANHSVHHSSEDYNLTVAMRLCIIEGGIEWIFLIPMVLTGFNPFQAVMALLLIAQYQSWIHTEHIGRLGWLDEWFNTPSVHRVHHGSNRRYLDRNYGGVLMIWDKLFGTFQREEERVVYGLTRNIETNNPVTINYIEYRHIWQELKKCRNLRERLHLLFGPLS